MKITINKKYPHISNFLIWTSIYNKMLDLIFILQMEYKECMQCIMQYTIGIRYQIVFYELTFIFC